MTEQRLYEDENAEKFDDPEEIEMGDRRLVTQPYDLVISALMEQIGSQILHLRPISDRPSFQRLYVWSDKLASRLIESILLNVPIPPCYFAQNEEYELDVIDGQQRIYSIYRFMSNQFKLRELEVLKDLNGLAFFELPKTLARKIETYTLRCVVVTNDSDPNFEFEVFKRSNTSTVPLNAQELRNSISRGQLINMLGDLVEVDLWLKILNKRGPDKRMRDQELILRFFAFHIHGLKGYYTPQKEWLNLAANRGRFYSDSRIEELVSYWISAIEKCLLVFTPSECFRRLPLGKRSVVNRALMDLTMYSLKDIPEESVKKEAKEFHRRYTEVVSDEEFGDLITRGIDHKTRSLRRFAIWDEKVTAGLF